MKPKIEHRKTPITVIVTGGLGFILSNFVKSLLESDKDAAAVILDVGPSDTLTTDFFYSVRDRLKVVNGDIRDRSILKRIASENNITHIVHAAVITHYDKWEREKPADFIDVNIMGTVNMLEWSRSLSNLRRFLYISSGGVYGSPTKLSTTSPQPETGPFNPPELYAISKYCSELIVRRYGELFGIDTCRVRFADVFGPMERPTPGRATMQMPYYMVRSVVEERPLRVTASTLEAGGDYLSAEDVACALLMILKSETLNYDVYNIAFGVYTKVVDIFNAFKETAPSFSYTVVGEGQADVILNPANRLARYNAYSIDRISSEFSWKPRPLIEQFASYFAWVMRDPSVRCPMLNSG